MYFRNPYETAFQTAASTARVYEIARRTAKKLFATSKWSRTFALARTPQTVTLQELSAGQGDIVVLENPKIAGNVGAIIRTAAALDAGGIVLLDASMGSYDRRLIRASRGLVFALPIVHATLSDLRAFCARCHWPLVVTDADAPRTLEHTITAAKRLVIAFGSEKYGCSSELREAAQLHVKIPTHPRVESLNLSAAAAIILFQRTYRSRRSHPQ